MMTFPIMIYKVAERSMEPAIKEGSYLVVNCWYRKVAAKEIVVLRANGMVMVKRIDRIEGSRIFVVGDNRESSMDSRKLGWMDRKDIVGKLIVVI